MPGTGHSARYKGSISNRVRISPFQRLAEWNAQLLGADGAVPTITGGGGGLAFKKLDASDIAGVMTNPASTAGGGSLDMSCLDITSVRQLKFCQDGYIRIPRGPGTASQQQDELIITNNNTNPNIQIQDKPLKLSSLGLSSTTNHVDLILDAAASATNNIELSARGVNTNNGKIFIGWEPDPGAASTDVRTINIGHRTTLHGGKQVINIGVVSTASAAVDAGQITIGSAAINTFTNINAGTNLSLGNVSTIQASLTSATTHVTGINRLNLNSGSSGDVYIGQTANSKIGFRGAIPIPQSSMNIGANLTTPAPGVYNQTTLTAVIDKVNLIINALVTVGLCQS